MNRRSSIGLALLAPLFVAGCATTDAWPVATSQSVAWNADPAIPAAVRPPEGHVLLGHLVGRGTATFTLQHDPNDAARQTWVLTDDRGGELTDDDGRVVAHHDGHHFVADDGARLTAEPLARAVTSPNRLPWTLSRATAHEGTGLFARTLFVQQLHTLGSPPPVPPATATAATAATASTTGSQTQVEYSADYYFYGHLAPQTRRNRGAHYAL